MYGMSNSVTPEQAKTQYERNRYENGNRTLLLPHQAAIWAEEEQRVQSAQQSLWPSAMASDTGRHTASPDVLESRAASGKQMDLAHEALRFQVDNDEGGLWPTVLSGSDGEKAPNEHGAKGGVPLNQAAKGWEGNNWPTPTTAPGAANAGSNQKNSEPSLEAQAVRVTARSGGLLDPKTSTHGVTSSTKQNDSTYALRLNPIFVEWLMGLPEGWVFRGPPN